jgi:hypothetical protein
MNAKFRFAISTFGTAAKSKLSNRAATGQPEDQLRAPLKRLISDLSEMCGFKRSEVTAVGESSLSELKTRPDYAITVRTASFSGWRDSSKSGGNAGYHRLRRGQAQTPSRHWIH